MIAADRVQATREVAGTICGVVIRIVEIRDANVIGPSGGKCVPHVRVKTDDQFTGCGRVVVDGKLLAGRIEQSQQRIQAICAILSRVQIKVDNLAGVDPETDEVDIDVGDDRVTDRVRGLGDQAQVRGLGYVIVIVDRQRHHVQRIVAS